MESLRERLQDPMRTERRAEELVARDLKDPEVVDSLVRSHDQMLNAEGREWRDIYLPDGE